jgi:hypothetical protein
MNKLARNLLIVGLALGVWGISFLFKGDSSSSADDSTQEICHAQLDEIQRAKLKWAKDNHQTGDAVPTKEQLLPYLLQHKMPACPGYGKYSINSVTNPPRCSIETHVYP